MKEFNCKLCGKNFTPKVYNKIYCSKKCYVKTRLKNPNGKNCIICGKIIIATGQCQKCCSKECSKINYENYRSSDRFKDLSRILELKRKGKRRDYSKSYYQLNKDKIIAKHKMRSDQRSRYIENYKKTPEYQLYLKNRYKNKLYKQRLYYARHRSERLDYLKKYQEINKDKLKLYYKNWSNTLNGKLFHNKHSLLRRERENNIIHSFTKEQWKQKLESTKGICPGINGICLSDNPNVGINKLTLDHKYPISKANEDFKLTGIKRIYTIDDVQPLCLICNISKSNKLDLAKDLFWTKYLKEIDHHIINEDKKDKLSYNQDESKAIEVAN